MSEDVAMSEDVVDEVALVNELKAINRELTRYREAIHHGIDSRHHDANVVVAMLQRVQSSIDREIKNLQTSIEEIKNQLKDSSEKT